MENCDMDINNIVPILALGAMVAFLVVLTGCLVVTSLKGPSDH